MKLCHSFHPFGTMQTNKLKENSKGVVKFVDFSPLVSVIESFSGWRNFGAGVKTKPFRKSLFSVIERAITNMIASMCSHSMAQTMIMTF